MRIRDGRLPLINDFIAAVWPLIPAGSRPDLRDRIDAALSEMGESDDPVVLLEAVFAALPAIRSEVTALVGQYFRRPAEERMKTAAEVSVGSVDLRHVNTCFVRVPGGASLGAGVSLAVDFEYYLRVDIGPLSVDSIVENPQPFPAWYLPRSTSGHWIVIDVFSEDFTIDDGKRWMFVPEVGSGWVCGCSPGVEHLCDSCSRTAFVYLPVRTPLQPGPARLRLHFSCRGHLVQSQAISTDIQPEEQDGVGTHGRIDFSLSGGLAGLGTLPARDVRILSESISGESHSLTIGGLDRAGLSFRLTEGQMGAAVSAVRAALRNIHMDENERILTRADNSKSVEGFVDDLRQLAPLGRLLHDVLLGDRPEERRLLRDRLREPVTLQVARSGRSTFVFPWSLVYDLPLDSNRSAYRPCRIVQRLKPEELAPAACPFAREHRLNTLCPYGFWGYRHTIEQPPSMPPLRTLPMRISAANLAMVVGLSTRLNRSMTARHVAALRGCLPDVTLELCDSRDRVIDELARTDLPLVYFYCHGRRDALPGTRVMLPYLEVGQNDRITPGDVTAWFDGLWEDGHWETTSPLVLINGCHTVDLGPDSLAQFVDAFAGVYAAGVIGTETAVHQALAGEVAERFWRRFRSGGSVGEALADVRLHLLGKRNLLGLAYTAYSSAELKLAGLPG